MNNLIILVGKVVNIEKENNCFTLKVDRPFRDNNGQVSTDLFICKVWKGMYSYISSYINLDDTILIKGKIILEKDEYIVKVEDFSLIKRAIKKISA